jgi:hypothetical protein
MNLFFDDVVAFVNENPGITELRTLKETDVQKFLVSNIAAILPRQYARLELPGIAPPYPNLWFEWVTKQDTRLKFGVFMVSEKTGDGWDCTFFFFNSAQSKRSPVFFCSIGASFLIPRNGRFSEIDAQ